MIVRYAILIVFLTFTSHAYAVDFPTGTLKGIGFKVEKDNTTITDKDMYAYSSSMTIVQRSNDIYEFAIVAHLRRSPSVPSRSEKRLDVLKVIWESSNSGRLINQDAAYQNDKMGFTISKNELVLKSWIARNQLWETHTYSLAKY